MHPIYFYWDAQGRCPIADYIAELSHKNDKDSRIKLNKLRDYVKMLSLYGTQTGEPYIKHLGTAPHSRTHSLCRMVSGRIRTAPSFYETTAKDTRARDCTGKTKSC